MFRIYFSIFVLPKSKRTEYIHFLSILLRRHGVCRAKTKPEREERTTQAHVQNMSYDNAAIVGKKFQFQPVGNDDTEREIGNENAQKPVGIDNLYVNVN
jgi:hypothetical protein